MTFYWWSHWFWITLLSSILLLSTIVHTYPSQEFNLEYNQNNRVAKSVTKLFQTGTTIKWSTNAPTSTQIMDLTLSGLSKEEKELENKSASKEAEEITDRLDDIEELEIEDDKNELKNKNDSLEHESKNYDEAPSKEEEEEEDVEDFEFKRSAENKETKTHENLKQAKNDTHDSAITISKKPTITMTEDDSLSTKTKSDDTSNINGQHKINDSLSNLSTNTTERNTANVTINPVHQTPPSAPSAPLIDAQPAAAEWLRTIIPQLPPPMSQQNLDDISSNMVTTSAGSQKIPFTLENVNREDELRRAENEHRTRKSKVLSAEYKHINRYINYSSDPRSLLARSASASPNDFNIDSESNISSEALAIQRTYFLDAGAISAICFTVFGICCTVGTVGIVLYRRRYLNKPQTLSEPDSSVYIDDSTMRVSDNSDEMYSLDNDSFLNSLEAMTIQNYWTDTVKHTKL